MGFEPTLDRSLSPLPLPIGLRRHLTGCFRFVPPEGFEPSLADPKSDVLSVTLRRLINPVQTYSSVLEPVAGTGPAGTLVEIRTQDPQLRRLLLYPTELREQIRQAKLT